MKHWTRFLLAVLALAALTGCLPQERFWWSPDGHRAAVLLDGTLHLANASGELVGQLSDEAQSAAWLPKGDGLLVHRLRTATEWTQVEPLLPEDEVERIEQLSAALPHLLRGVSVMGGDEETAQKLLAPLLEDEPEMAQSAFLHAEQTEPAALWEALQAAPKLEKSLRERPQEERQFTWHELVLIPVSGSGEAGEPQVLVRSVNALTVPEPSPAFPLFAYARRDGGQSFALEIRSLDNQQVAQVANGTLGEFAWTPDGRSLVYAAALDEGSLLKRIRKAEVASVSGAIIPAEQAAPDIDLATALIPFVPRLEVLPNNQVLFAAQPATWPAQDPNPQSGPKLYLVPAAGGAITAIPVPEGSLPSNLGHFVPSPDGRLVAIVESDTDAVAVVEVATGRLQLISQSHLAWKCRTLPAWRSPDELTYAALDSKTSRVRWMLWNGSGESQDLSAGWPADRTKGWLEKKEPSNRPLTSP